MSEHVVVVCVCVYTYIDIDIQQQQQQLSLLSQASRGRLDIDIDIDIYFISVIGFKFYVSFISSLVILIHSHFLNVVLLPLYLPANSNCIGQIKFYFRTLQSLYCGAYILVHGNYLDMFKLKIIFTLGLSFVLLGIG
jgi:hypothetical protein